MKKDVIMKKPFDVTEIEGLIFSVCKLLDVLIRIYPEDVYEELDEEVFLTILAKAKQDAEALRTIIEAQLK